MADNLGAIRSYIQANKSKIANYSSLVRTDKQLQQNVARADSSGQTISPVVETPKTISTTPSVPVTPQNLQPNISLVQGGVGYAERSGMIRILEPVALAKTPEKVETIRSFTRDVPGGRAGEQEIVTEKRITPRVIYGQTGTLQPAPQATPVERLLTRGAILSRDIGSEFGKFIQAPFDAGNKLIHIEGSDFFTLPQSAQSVLTAGKNTADPVGRFIAEVPFQTPARTFETGASFTKILTGRPTTTSEKIDVITVPIVAAVSGAAGFVEGRAPYVQNILKLTKESTPFVKGLKITSLIIGGGIVGGATVYGITTSPNPRQAALDAFGDMGKLQLVSSVSATGGAKLGKYLSEPRYVVSDTGLRKAGIIETKLGATDITRASVKPIQLKQEIQLKNLLGEKFTESLTGEVSIKGTQSATSFESNVVRLRALEKKGVSILTGASNTRGSFYKITDALTPESAEFVGIGRTATRQVGSPKTIIENFGVKDIITRTEIGSEPLQYGSVPFSQERIPTIVKRVFDVQGTSRVFKLSSELSNTFPKTGSLIAESEKQFSTELNFNPKTFFRGSEVRGKIVAIEDINRNRIVEGINLVTGDIMSPQAPETYSISLRNLFPIGKKAQVSLGTRPIGTFDTGFEIIQPDIIGQTKINNQPFTKIRERVPTIITGEISAISPQLRIPSAIISTSITPLFASGLSQIPSLNIQKAITNPFIVSQISGITRGQISPQSIPVGVPQALPQSVSQFVSTSLTGTGTQTLTTPQSLVTPLTTPSVGFGFPNTPAITQTFITPLPFPIYTPGIGFPEGEYGPRSGLGKLFGKYTYNIRGLTGINIGPRAIKGQTFFSGQEIRPLTFGTQAPQFKRRRGRPKKRR